MKGITVPKKPLKKDEIRELYQLESHSLDSVRLLAVPKELSPELYNNIRGLCHMLPSRVRILDPIYQSTIGREMLVETAHLFKIYSRFSKKLIRRDSAKRELKIIISDLSSHLLILAENGQWNETESSRIGGLIGNIEIAIEKSFNAKKGK